LPAAAALCGSMAAAHASTQLVCWVQVLDAGAPAVSLLPAGLVVQNAVFTLALDCCWVTAPACRLWHDCRGVHTALCAANAWQPGVSRPVAEHDGNSCLTLLCSTTVLVLLRAGKQNGKCYRCYSLFDPASGSRLKWHTLAWVLGFSLMHSCLFWHQLQPCLHSLTTSVLAGLGARVPAMSLTCG
jgi:hypothetical protein